MGSSYLFFKVLFGAVALGFICLLLVGSLDSAGNTVTAALTTQSTRNLHHFDAFGREKFIDHHELDLNYMSKRRVPNGPDPIHNRRAGNSGRPPGQS